MVRGRDSWRGWALETGGKDIMPGFDPEMFRIRPKRIASWGLDGERAPANARSVA
jgi:hypothetical protein